MGSTDNPRLTLFKVSLMTSAMQCPPFSASFISCLTQEDFSHRHRGCPTGMQSPPAASPAPGAVPNLQRGLWHIQHPQLLPDPAALAGEAACCWDRGLHLGVRSCNRLPFHCQLVLFVKCCSGISLISHVIVAIKKAAGKLGNRFLRVKDKKGKPSSRGESETQTLPTLA